MATDPVFARLDAKVIQTGLCTHCGTCVGLSRGALEMTSTPRGPLPARVRSVDRDLPSTALDACPGNGINYPDLNAGVFGAQPENWLIGCWRKLYVGFSRVGDVRRAGASGGVITQTLIYLLENSLVDGVVAVRQGQPRPWQAEPVIATTVDEVMACSQSVYVPVPVNTILPQMERFQGTLAYVGMPDHVASLRRLQALGHPGARKVEYVLGPYFGIGIYSGAVESYLRSHGVDSIDEVTELRYREGEWPGYLQVRTRTGRVLRAAKFYYNYLLPFYATRATLLSVDFTNELTDFSVGDAWQPKYERQGQGFSIIVARTPKGEGLLSSMRDRGLLSLEECSLREALSMHGHMLDFKKRGAFIRMSWRKALGRAIPDYGYRPSYIPLTRKLAEAAIVTVFAIGSTSLARGLVERIPIGVLGPVFNFLRVTWKRLSKPTKRAGLSEFQVETWHGAEAMEKAESSHLNG